MLITAKRLLINERKNIAANSQPSSHSLSSVLFLQVRKDLLMFQKARSHSSNVNKVAKVITVLNSSPKLASTKPTPYMLSHQ